MSESPQLPHEAAKVHFCLELGKALHSFGTPAHRFEEAMSLLAHSMGLEGQFLAHPTAFFAEIESTHGREVYMVRAEPGGQNLGKAVRIQGLVREVIAGKIAWAEAADRVKLLVAEPSRFPVVVTLACFGLTSSTAARFFGGGWREMALTFLLGVLVGTLGYWTGKRPHYAQVFVLLASTLAGFGGVFLAHQIGHTAAFTLTLASIVVLLPGLKLTIALREVATGNLVAGSSRLTDAGMDFLMLAFGVALGRQMALQFAHAYKEALSIPLPAWTEWAALILAPVSFLVLFEARREDFKWILLSCFVAYLSARLGAAWLGPELGAGLGALGLGLAANVFGRLSRLPNQIMVIPGLVLLVPGSVGFRGMAFLSMGETEVGVQTAFRMVFLAVALVMGLSLAHAAVPARKGL